MSSTELAVSGFAPRVSSDLTWVKIPTGGGTQWVWENKIGMSFTEKELTGLLVVVGSVEQTLWPHSKTSEKSSPLLVTTDGVTAYKFGSDYGERDVDLIEAARRDDGTYEVAKIPYFHWEGRGTGAKPPVAKPSRVVGILREGSKAPLFIRVPSTSLPAITRVYEGLRSEGIGHWRGIVRLTLEKRKGRVSDYAVMAAAVVGVVDEEVGARMKAEFTDRLTAVACPPIADRVRRSSEDAVEKSEDTSAVPF